MHTQAHKHTYPYAMVDVAAVDVVVLRCPFSDHPEYGRCGLLDIDARGEHGRS